MKIENGKLKVDLNVNGQQTPLLESENLKTSESEKGCEQRAMSHEVFFETEKSVNISGICGKEKETTDFTDWYRRYLRRTLSFEL